MRYRQLGPQLKVSELGFGAGGYWGMPLFEESVARSLVDIALEHGVTLFDTGPNYSNANAEVRLGRCLGKRAPDLVIATKGGTHYRGLRHQKDYSYAALRSSLDESFRRLGRGNVDLYQLHGLPDELADDTRRFLEDIKASGEARLLGVSTSSAGATQVMGLGLFDVVMIAYNVIKRREPEATMDKAATNGVGVLVKSPLAQTLYSNEIFKVRSLSDLWYLARAFKNHRHGLIEGRKYRFIDSHATALQFVLSNQNVSAAIVGTTSPAHLLANLEAANHEIDQGMLARIRNVAA